MIEIIVPKLYEDLESALLLEWSKKEGDRVEVGDVLFRLETDKTVFDVESEKEGILRQILVQGDSRVNVMQVVGLLSSEKE